jgi:hypothetical protein
MDAALSEDCASGLREDVLGVVLMAIETVGALPDGQADDIPLNVVPKNSCE